MTLEPDRYLQCLAPPFDISGLADDNRSSSHGVVLHGNVIGCRAIPGFLMCQLKLNGTSSRDDPRGVDNWRGTARLTIFVSPVSRLL